MMLLKHEDKCWAGVHNLMDVHKNVYMNSNFLRTHENLDYLEHI